MKHDAAQYKILFICTGNSARSIFGEYLIKRLGKGRFQSYSAGANPTGRMNPYAQRILRDIYHIETSDARSKGFEGLWDEQFDFVITVCDNARKTCPVWPGQPIIAHWGAPDPALAAGTDEEIYRELSVALLDMTHPRSSKATESSQITGCPLPQSL